MVETRIQGAVSVIGEIQFKQADTLMSASRLCVFEPETTKSSAFMWHDALDESEVEVSVAMCNSDISDKKLCT
jgi:hypothetical protein